MKINKDTIKYILFGVSCLFILLLGELSILFKPMYDWIYYGTLNSMFDDIIKAIIMIIGVITMVIVSKKILGYNPLRSKEYSRKEELPIKNLIVLTLIVTSAIALISSFVGWQVKILADLGERYTGVQVGLAAVGWACASVRVLVALMMINYFQEGMEKSINNKYISWGGLLLLVTFGLYELVMGLTTLPVIYLLLTVVYGEIYLLTHKNTWKSFLLIYVIYLL